MYEILYVEWWVMGFNTKCHTYTLTHIHTYSHTHTHTHIHTHMHTYTDTHIHIKTKTCNNMTRLTDLESGGCGQARS